MELTSAREVIDILGGLKAVSELTGVTTITVSAWQTRLETMPAKTFVVLTSALEKRGHTAPPSLWGMIEHRRRRRAS